LKKTYAFQARRKPELCRQLGISPDLSFTLELTQEEFEDYQLLKSCVHEKLLSIGIPKGEDVYWFENPPVANFFLEKLRAAIGSSGDAQFIAHYPHSYHHRTYKDVAVDGVRYKYMPFQHDLIIKFAPVMA
jgi:hypothetical protein